MGRSFHPSLSQRPGAGDIHAIAAGIRRVQYAGLLSLLVAFVARDLSTPIELLIRSMMALAAWKITSPGPSERSPGPRRLLRAAWLLMLLPAAIVPEPISYVQWFVPAATFAFMASHTRPSTDSRRYARGDVLAALSIAATVSILRWAEPDAREAQAFAPWLVAGVGFPMLWLWIRLLVLGTSYHPGALPDLWRKFARANGARMEEEPSSFRWHLPHGGTLEILRDPIPACTVLRVEMPWLLGVRARRRETGEQGGLSLGLLLDSAIYVEGDPERARLLRQAPEIWIEALHGWHATLEGGVLTATFEGEIPRGGWLSERGGPKSTDRLVIQRIVQGCRELVAPPEGSPGPSQRSAEPQEGSTEPQGGIYGAQRGVYGALPELPDASGRGVQSARRAP